MTNEEIERFLQKQQINEGQQVKISFKKRNTLHGVFIKSNDYAELKSKNFWRIVTGPPAENWMQSKNMEAVRIFNGAEFSGLSAVKQ